MRLKKFSLKILIYFQNKLGVRVLDCFFYEGREIFFKFGLALLKIKSEKLLQDQGNRIVSIMKDHSDLSASALFKVITLKKKSILMFLKLIDFIRF